MAFRGILAEVERSLRDLFSRPIENISFAIMAPLWLAFFILSLRGFGVSGLSTFDYQVFTWVAYLFAIYSTWLWGVGQGIADEGSSGILEHIEASGISIFTHILGEGIAYASYGLMDLAVIVISIRLLAGFWPSLSNPPLFALSLLLTFLELTFLSSIYSMLIINMRSSWVITSILQFILPALGGLLPSVMNRYVFLMDKYSPLAYPPILLRESALGINELGEPISLQVSLSVITVAALGAVSYMVCRLVEANVKVRGLWGL